MLGESRQHVVEEAHPGRDQGAARAIEIETDADLRLRGLPFEAGSTGLADRISLSVSALSTDDNASLKASISAGVPADTRSQPSGPVSRISTPRSSKACHTAWRSPNRPKSTKLASDSATWSPLPASQLAKSSRACRS